MTFEARARDFFLEYCRSNADDFGEGYVRLRQQIRNILLQLEQCHLLGLHEKLLDFLESCSYFLYDAGYWQERLRWVQYAYEAALQLAATSPRETHRAAKCAYWIGWFRCRVEDYEGALDWAAKADQAFRASPFPSDRREPRVTQLLGLVATGQERDDAAEQLFLEALHEFQLDVNRSTTERVRGDKTYWVMTVETNLGDLEKARGATGDISHFQKAKKWYELVLDECKRRRSGVHDRYMAREARTLGNLGDVHRKLNDPQTKQTALDYYRQGYKTAQTIGLLNTQGACALGMAFLLERDNPRQAYHYFKEGVAIYDRLGSRARGHTSETERARQFIKSHPEFH